MMLIRIEELFFLLLFLLLNLGWQGKNELGCKLRAEKVGQSGTTDQSQLVDNCGVIMRDLIQRELKINSFSRVNFSFELNKLRGNLFINFS